MSRGYNTLFHFTQVPNAQHILQNWLIFFEILDEGSIVRKHLKIETRYPEIIEWE